jgi:hypothetical protein
LAAAEVAAAISAVQIDKTVSRPMAGRIDILSIPISRVLVAGSCATL